MQMTFWPTLQNEGGFVFIGAIPCASSHQKIGGLPDGYIERGFPLSAMLSTYFSIGAFVGKVETSSLK
jgi:hypothetical protein